ATASFLSAVADDLAASPGVEHCKRLLTLVPRATDWYSSVGMASPDGRIYCGATTRGFVQPTGRVNVSNAAWFRRAQTERGFVLAELGPGPFSHRKALLASHAVDRGRFRRPAVVFAALDVDQLTKTIGLQDSPRGTKYVILDNRGTLVARVPDDAPAGSRHDERSLLETVLRDHQGTAEIKEPDGVTTIYGFTPVGGTAQRRLFISAGRTADSIYADPNHDLRRYVLLAGLGLLAALALSYVMTTLLLGRWSSAVVESARRFGAGDLTARAPVPTGLGELTDVANALNAAAVEIQHRQASQARLLTELVVAEEETRRRIALDIHDDTAQAVAAAGLRMDALAAELKDPAERAAVLKAREALIEANRRLRRLLFELRPPALDEAGLGAALELFLTDSFTHDGFDWSVENRLDDEPAPEARAILYRVALEALTNVRKHANASLVEVLLERRGVGVMLQVVDDGAGFDLPPPDAPAEPGHIGLVSMRERAEAAGGRFAMTSAPGSGTTVEFWMPEKNARPATPESPAASPPPPPPHDPTLPASRRPAGGGS
ncbi:MAG TPA: ATP-binding protein, partial [Thermoleophilaceae bacterium]|nr:ATP-binding protein [Thermoleophilaceae bacterium]